ncbi:hypothetical protein [Cupriavidus sp. WS]|uniref:hypothetical protein n=1 Tax=Cupriavidus sp. WS TaxID=1312922 RepID=UPI0003653D95|nr:hypothetical protein [Cupriavidus sp. WS]
MFSTARSELRELHRLVAETDRYDASLAARPEIVPSKESTEERMRKEHRKAELVMKYELDR